MPAANASPDGHFGTYFIILERLFDTIIEDTLLHEFRDENEIREMMLERKTAFLAQNWTYLVIYLDPRLGFQELFHGAALVDKKRGKGL